MLSRSLAGAIALAWFVTPAMAHITVLPERTVVDSPLELTIRVPTEGPVATTGVDVRFPPEFVVYSFATPPPGWAIQTKLATDGTFSGVVYRGGPSGRDRYVDFHVLANATKVGTARWTVVQRFSDGSTKPWIGPPDSLGAASPETGPGESGPAAAVRVVSANDSTENTLTSSSSKSSGTGTWLGVIAIAIAAAAAALAGLAWSSRPARLPEDRPGE